ncbi:ABC transporter permease subunit [Duganella sp. FT135W]|uniref:ABC transporter permease subunit n=2 Tax=Duganella flavida TaxID=2692175 RepID=A0A6L8KB60_9BURK|nr:ABC transporter permease subunit [Duganella flavida]
MTKWFSRGWLGSVYIFLYLPILSLVVFSFNESTLVTVWSQFSFKWYQSLMHDQELIDGLLLSLRIAFTCAALSVVLGTMGALVVVRYKKFRGRVLFESMLNMPLVMPEVIMALSVMLLLVMVQDLTGIGGRDMKTILLGHTQLGMAYAAVVVASRLRELNISLEEAAQDLGARPLQVFWYVTLPLILPSLVSAFLLTFTLSFDDVVISAFLAGPGATTLPVVIFSRAKFGLNPTVNAAAAATIFVVTACVILSALYESRLRRRRLREARQRDAAQAVAPSATPAAPRQPVSVSPSVEQKHYIKEES